MSSRAFITGISGPTLTTEEREFIRSSRPWGFILFKRNAESPRQVISLLRELRDAVGNPDAPVLIDQEGGRVQRLRPPNWPLYPSGADFGVLYDRDRELGLKAARLSARLIAADLSDLGITVDCLPLADVPIAGADDVIGDRAYGNEPGKVAAIARAVTEGLEQGGILPVLKHIPGHGRALADSHESLPRVENPRAELERTDFAAFRPLADLPMAMTAHVVFSALDPAQPATTSATIIREVIRGVIGFQGLLMSDDVSMNALSGTLAERTRAIVGAGCDMVLYCNGKLDEMREVARETPELSGQALERAKRALASRKPPQGLRPQGGPGGTGRVDGSGKGGGRMSAEILSFETGRPAELSDDEPSLVVDVEGYEGPLDLLLALARQQKVDLAKISILALANQYLEFIEAARKIRLELAADYLVMAAWLAFLKSRLLLPEPPTADGPSAEEMATALANRLRRLEAIREGSNRLMNRPQLQRDIFPRGNPETIAEIRHPRFTATLFDLLTAYAAQRQQRVLASVHLAKRTVWSLTEARASLERLVGMAQDWSRLDEYLINFVADPSQKATVFASSFAAALELVREGEMELHQKEAFAPLYFRKRPPQPASDAMTAPDLPAE